MYELQSPESDVPMIPFGVKDKDGKDKILFELPVLGSKGVPMGIVSSFSLFWEKFQTGRSLTEREVAASWNFFIETLRDTYPDAVRRMAQMDEPGIGGVIKHWVKESEENGGFDPKAD